MSDTFPGKFKCSLLKFFFCPDEITPNSGSTGPNNTIYIYIYCQQFIIKTGFVKYRGNLLFDYYFI